MRYAILGDIHGNYYAFEAVINYIENEFDNELTGFIFTGDYVGDFSDGSKVVDLIQKISKEYKTYIIKGNRETGQVEEYLKQMEQGKEPDWSLDTTMGAALVSCRELGKDRMEYLKSLPNTCIINNHGKRPIFIKHKMPLDEEELKRVKEDNMVVITAHTHEAHEETKDGITLFNPGSVGLPDDGVVAATFGIMESNDKSEWDFTVRDIKYDYGKTIESLKSNKDLYDRCCGWGKALELSLRTGVNCTSLYSMEAKRLATLVKQAKDKGKDLDLDKVEQGDIFSQNRYGNVNYDGSKLTDMHLQNVDGVEVFGQADVLSVGNKEINLAKPTSEIFKRALNNVIEATRTSDRNTVFTERHEDVVKR